MTTRYVLVCHGPGGSLDAVNAHGDPALHLGRAITFASIREAVDFNDGNVAVAGASMSVMTVEKYEQRKIEQLIAGEGA